MANNLTGGFDAVVQFAIRQINGVLATLHQNGASDDATLKLLHRATVRIGHSKWRTPDVTSFGDWVVEYRPRILRWTSTTCNAADVVGAARRRQTVRARVRPARRGPPDAGPRPPEEARLQIGSPTLTVPDGSTSK